MNLFRKRKIHLWLARCLIAAFALAQIAPPGFAFAASDDGPKIVICDGHGGALVSWKELTGDPSPYKAPEDSSQQSCPACTLSCRTAAAIAPSPAPLEIRPAASFHVLALPAAEAAIAPRTLPPAPSRAPPSLAA